MLTISACKADESHRSPITDLTKTTSMDTRSAVSGGTSANESVTQKTVNNSASNYGAVTTIITLTPSGPGNNPASVRPLFMQPNLITFNAIVVYDNGFSSVSLDSVVKSSGSTTIRATILDVRTSGRTIYFTVNYQYYENGAWSGSSQASYSVTS